MPHHNTQNTHEVHARLIHIPASGILLRAWRILNARCLPRLSSAMFALLGSSSLSSSAPSPPPAIKSRVPGSIALERSRSAYEALRRVVDGVCRRPSGKADTVVPARSERELLGRYDAKDSGSLRLDNGLISIGSEVANPAFPRDHRTSEFRQLKNVHINQPSLPLEVPKLLSSMSSTARPSSVSSGIRAPGTPFRRLLTNSCQALLFRFHAPL